MKIQIDQRKKFLKRLKPKLSAMMFFTLAAMLIAPSVHAEMAADAVIMNVVTVSYTDASGNNPFYANAAAIVTVSLVESPVTISGRPTDTLRGTSAPLPSEQTVSSGSTAPYIYAITSGANGDDEYFFNISNVTDHVTNDNITTQLLNPDGTDLGAPDPSSVTLEASVIVDVTANDTLLFPADTFTNLTSGAVLVIDGIDYLVDTVSAGQVANHSHADGNSHSDLGTLLSAEVLVQVELLPNPDGGQMAPAFDNNDIGTPAFQQILFSVQVSAEADEFGNDGTVAFDILATTDAPGSENIVDFSEVTTTFTAVNLTIQKLVTNIADGTFAATAQGISGDILEYQVTVTNSGGNAANVVVTDTVPDYTTLIDDAYSGDFADFSFTNASGVSTPGTMAGGPSTAVDNADLISGVAPDNTAGSSLTFYVGQGHDPADATNPGGTLLTDESVVIRYQVQID